MKNSEIIIFGNGLQRLPTLEVQGHVEQFIQKHGADIVLPVIKYDLLPLMRDQWKTETGRISLIEDIVKSMETRPPKKANVSLEQMFDSNDLKKLVNLLLERKFITKEPDGYHWTGIESRNAKGRGLQLVALAKVCRPLYRSREYKQKDIWQAWTSYFHNKTRYTVWTPKKVETINETYFLLFNSIKHSFSIR